MEDHNMGKFIIQPHGRLQEWIAHEKGYFRDEGLDYEFRHGLASGREKQTDAAGAGSEIRSGKSYVVAPGGIMVPPDSPIRTPQNLAGIDIAVGYHSGSHFTTIQSLEPFLAPDQIRP